MTEKLYEAQPRLTVFSARVLTCEKAADGWEITLDRTAFYPEGGGQPWDLGELGGIPVLAVRSIGDTVTHTCAAPLPVGQTVEGRIDWARRLDLMQQHSGEHIVSGLIHSRFGYSNVGFHMGKDRITIDFSGPIHESELEEIELAANRAVWQDLPIRCFYPKPETLSTLPYRSKKALEGPVRLVEIPGIDLCACCGTHVERTGEIGLIKLLSCVKFHQGVRVEMLAGGRALALMNQYAFQNRQISGLLSAKPEETAGAVRSLAEALEQEKRRAAGLEQRLIDSIARNAAGSGAVLLAEPALSSAGLRRLATALGNVCSGPCAVLCGSGGCFRYILAHPGGDLRELGQRWNQALRGRGGGQPGFLQGTVQASLEEIRRFWSSETGCELKKE